MYKVITETNGHIICPNCKTNNLEILNYDLSDNKELGLFMFKLRCKNCNKKYIHYTSLT